MRKPLSCVCSAICLMLSTGLMYSSPAQSDTADVQSLEAIEQSVHDFVMAQHSSTKDVQVSIKSLDKRLRLTACAEPLDALWSPGSRTLGRVTVQIECSVPRPWRVHVQATVTLEGHVWALARGVQRGEVLDSGMLVRQLVKLGANNAALSGLSTPIIDIEPWLGYAFSQRVGAGKVLAERMLKPANLVSKGETVVIRHVSPAVTLQTRGVALNDAAAGGRLQVRNASSGKIIDATAVARGQVQVLN